MGNCTGYCNACGDESTQIKTLDHSQLKNSMKDGPGQEPDYSQFNNQVHVNQQ